MELICQWTGNGHDIDKRLFNINKYSPIVADVGWGWSLYAN